MSFISTWRTVRLTVFVFRLDCTSFYSTAALRRYDKDGSGLMWLADERHESPILWEAWASSSLSHASTAGSKSEKYKSRTDWRVDLQEAREKNSLCPIITSYVILAGGLASFLL
jgi:hypothetical protein